MLTANVLAEVLLLYHLKVVFFIQTELAVVAQKRRTNLPDLNIFSRRRLLSIFNPS